MKVLEIEMPNDEKSKLKMDIINFSVYEIRKYTPKEKEVYGKIASSYLNRAKVHLHGRELEQFERILRKSAKDRGIRLTKGYHSPYDYKH